MIFHVLVIFENVANITSKDFKHTLDLFKNDLMNLGYKLYDNILNAVDYGTSQTRKRYFLISVSDNNTIENIKIHKIASKKLWRIR